jgi:hypothetical protein
MKKITSLEEANEVSAIRLTEVRRRPKAGDLFRLSPSAGIYLWGRLVKRGHFFGLKADFNLVYIYDVISEKRPDTELLKPSNLIIGPCVVNNLGWSRGYWQVIGCEPLTKEDRFARHLFVRFRGFGGPENHDIVDESGNVVKGLLPNWRLLGQSGFGSFNSVDWNVRNVLESRGILPKIDR